MVKLDRGHLAKKTTVKLESGSKHANSAKNRDKKSKVDIVKSQNPNCELEKFSLHVINVLADDNIPPSPNNFQIYFEKLLDNKPVSFRKRINELLESENLNDDEHNAKMELEIKDGFGEIKSIMKVVSTVYKNTNIMKEIVNKKSVELEQSTGQFSAMNIVAALIKDLQKLSSLMDKQMGVLRMHYEKTGTILKEIESKAVFDSCFGEYNKRSLLQTIQSESKSRAQFKHKSTLALIKIKDTVLDEISSAKERMILTRNIAKLLLKTSRRSDVVAHYGDGIFAALMKHTDINNAKRACERVCDLIDVTNFFIGDKEINADIELAIVPVVPEYKVEVLISMALDALPKSGKDLELYIVCEVEEESEDENGS